MKKSIFYLGLFIAFILFASNSNIILDKIDGKALYKKANCGSCHGKKGKSLFNTAPSLRNVDLTLKQRIEVITKGSEQDPTMIAFSPKYSAAEIKAIAEYTMTFIKL